MKILRLIFALITLLLSFESASGHGHDKKR